jgi:bifunctional DNA-binding transcriptional regulator/antitoxin component of YhaV-PrlF toxin-antitoxin module
MERTQENEGKSLGIVRRIDSMGRISVPVEIKKVYGWTPGTAIEMFAGQDGGLYIKKYGNDSKKEQLIDRLMNIADNAASAETNDAVLMAISYLRTDI